MNGRRKLEETMQGIFGRVDEGRRSKNPEDVNITITVSNVGRDGKWAWSVVDMAGDGRGDVHDGVQAFSVALEAAVKEARKLYGKNEYAVTDKSGKKITVTVPED